MKQIPIQIKEARAHNLKIDYLEIPSGKFTVVTGVSGSGKSSLVFDTLYGESYRRYVDSLSSYARQYMQAMPPPKVQDIANLPPAISVKQRRFSGNKRSSVGTLTELNDFIQVIFSCAAKIICYQCEKEIKSETALSIKNKIFSLHPTQTIFIMSPLSSFSEMNWKDVKQFLKDQGFTRIFMEQKVEKIDLVTGEQFYNGFVVIDRVALTHDEDKRIIDSLEMGLRMGRGSVYISPVDQFSLEGFSSKLTCLNCHIEYLSPYPLLFSFMHPSGVCKSCQGYGNNAEIDWSKVIPDLNSSLEGKGIACLNFGQHVGYYDTIEKFAKKRKLKSEKAFSLYTQEEKEWLFFGDGKLFEGLQGYFKWLDGQRHKPHYRIHASRFKKYLTCQSCSGKKFRKEVLSFQLFNENIASIYQKTIHDFIVWIEKITNQLVPSHRESEIFDALNEAKERVEYLKSVGLGYLSIDRSSATLSGGELQRIQMARCLGSSLTQTLYCLDEPTSGLHAKDTEVLVEIIKKIRDQGNTVVVVEHDWDVIKNADHVIEIGPKAGEFGGEVVYQGPPSKLKKFENLKRKKTTKKPNEFIALKKASVHNLKKINIKIPLNALTVVCGVSGSGKTTLIQECFYPLMEACLLKSGSESRDLLRGELSVAQSTLKKIENVVLISQKSIGRSSRSNIATYLGVYEPIRKLFSEIPEAKRLGLTAKDFSFNVPGGRCEVCKGLGSVVEDLSFLGDVTVTCPECRGKRFKKEVLSVKFHEHNLNDLLKLTVTQARKIFSAFPKIVKHLDDVVGMGMGYITLGQETSSFSGGEAQRLKLLSFSKDVGNHAKSSLLIFDEPTIGLSDFDVERLTKQWDSLIVKGHTIIVVEHHLQVIQNADWLIEIGPGSGVDGGQVVYQGGVEAFLEEKMTETSKFLVLTRG